MLPIGIVVRRLAGVLRFNVWFKSPVIGRKMTRVFANSFVPAEV